MPSFHARTVIDGDRGRLILAGEIDLANAHEIADLGLECLSRPEVAQLVVDLAAVTFMDSTALSALIRIRNSALDSTKRVSLANVPARVAKLLDLTGLATIFSTPDDLE